MFGVGHGLASINGGLVCTRVYGDGQIDGGWDLGTFSTQWHTWVPGTIALDGQDWLRITVVGGRITWWTGRGTSLAGVQWTIQAVSNFSTGTALPALGTRTNVTLELDAQSPGASGTVSATVTNLVWSSLGGL